MRLARQRFGDLQAGNVADIGRDGDGRGQTVTKQGFLNPRAVGQFQVREQAAVVVGLLLLEQQPDVAPLDQAA